MNRQGAKTPRKKKSNHTVCMEILPHQEPLCAGLQAIFPPNQKNLALGVLAVFLFPIQ